MDATLEAVKREGRGKNEANQLRASGWIPGRGLRDRLEGEGAGGCGGGRRSQGGAANPALGLGANTLITLKLDGGQSRVMVKEYQLDRSPITCSMLTSISWRWTRRSPSPCHRRSRGEPKGVKLQVGLLDFVTRDIRVQCLPTDIPEHIDVDVSES